MKVLQELVRFLSDLTSSLHQFLVVDRGMEFDLCTLIICQIHGSIDMDKMFCSTHLIFQCLLKVIIRAVALTIEICLRLLTLCVLPRDEISDYRTNSRIELFIDYFKLARVPKLSRGKVNAEFV